MHQNGSLAAAIRGSARPHETEVSISVAVVSNPRVGVIMGSDSDLPTMQAAIDILVEFGVPYEVRIVSAHRTPDVMFDYARTAADRGLQVIIAGAGGAAHLPGMTASMTSLPVIGVPVPLAQLDGLDSLLSIVQMPGGIPVATVAIGNAKNAGLLAVRILGANDDKLRAAMERYQADLSETVREKDRRLSGSENNP
jgi:5-(carboxyamino)imidazole ribonucleotide mutase